MIPSLPYAWQDKNGTEMIDSFRGGSLSVLGFLSHDHSFQSYAFKGTINSDVVIECIENFSKSISGPIYLIMDNSPIHKCDDFLEKIPEWEKAGIFIKFIPPYSPELNKIEILWRFIKYKWLPFSSFSNFGNFQFNLFEILKGIGSKYRINFSFL